MKKQSILLTGATGALGRVLLPEFLRRPEVERVYVVLRRASHERLPERVKRIFGDIRVPHTLGISPAHLELVRSNVMLP